MKKLEIDKVNKKKRRKLKIMKTVEIKDHPPSDLNQVKWIEN